MTTRAHRRSVPKAAPEETLQDEVALLKLENARLRDLLLEERRARAEAERFLLMSELSTDFVAMASPDGKALYVNPAGRQMCGLGPDESISTMTIPDFHTPGEIEERVAEAVSTCLRVGVWRGETEILSRDGTIVPGSQLLIAHRDARGALMFLSTVIRDNRRIRDLQAQLAQGQRLEAIGRLAGGVAHDFNNLLTVIENFVAFVHDDLPEDSPSRADLEQALTATGRAGSLCRQLLSFARKQLIKPTPTELNLVVSEFASLIRRIVGEDIRVELALSESLGLIVVDSSQLDQILANLVINARDAIVGGGRITIGTRNLVIEAETTMGGQVVTPGKYVELSVSDDGTGMDADILSRAFEPFFSTKKPGKGTGLGLATVFGAVTQNHGHLLVESTVGVGTTFFVLWPQTTRVLPAPGSKRATRRLTGHETILLVEDEPVLRSLTARMLSAGGYRVVEADDPSHALAIATNSEEKLDLLLTDVVMPDMDGHSLAARIRSHRPSLPVLFTSGYTRDTIDRGSVLDQDIHFLAKPFNQAQLLEAVGRAAGDKAAQTTPD